MAATEAIVADRLVYRSTAAASAVGASAASAGAASAHAATSAIWGDEPDIEP
jgi:hypothetical protein